MVDKKNNLNTLFYEIYAKKKNYANKLSPGENIVVGR